MKKGRGHIFTTGLCNTFVGTDQKTLFFELDKPFSDFETNSVLKVYFENMLDVLVHRTGNGLHFVSPTLMSKEKWKEIIAPLREINSKCPMNTLRMQPNKYPNEDQYWYTCRVYRFNNINNSHDMCTYLNKLFRSGFLPNLDLDYDLKIVRYPLPEGTGVP